MNKNYCRRFLALAVSAVGLFGLSCCEQGEIDDLREEVKRQEARIASLEEWQKSVNTDIQSLKAVLKGLESKDYVTSVTPLSDGSGYTLSFEKSGSVTIRNGKKGDAPVISVKPGSDGRYYWTIDGSFLTDKDGNKVPATGAPGSDGDTPYIGANGHWWIGSKDTGVKAQGVSGEPGIPGSDGDTPYIGANGHWWIGSKDTGVNAQGAQGEPGEPGAPGTPGKDGLTPKLRINAGTDEWEVSVDDGATWQSTGVKATGRQGDSWFKGIDISRSDYVELTLADGTLLRLPRYAEMFVKFDGYEPFLCTETPCELPLILPESLKENDYTALMATVTFSEGSVSDIATRAASGWGVKIVKPSFNEDGTLVPGSAKVRITEIPEEEDSKALLKVTLVDAEGREYSASRVLIGKPAVTPDPPSLVLDKSEAAFDAAGGERTVAVTANRDWTAEAAADWLTVAPASGEAAETAAMVTLTAEANESEAGRTATVTFKAEGVEKSLTVTQAGKVSSSVLVETAFGMELELVSVEGGTFWMGAQPTDPDGRNYDSEARSDEAPVHQVTLSDYYIGKYEVTQGQWQAVMGSNPSSFKKGDDYPVEKVSWDDIQSFIQKLNEQTGKRYVLPTEAQWEFAARGGNRSEGYKYSGGADLDELAWYGSNSGSTTHPVGTKAPNELGLYDMSGNVYEWCGDWVGDYDADAQTDPQGPADGIRRVLRGGSWYLDARDCRVSDRHDNTPGDRSINFGFRLVLLP